MCRLCRGVPPQMEHWRNHQLTCAYSYIAAHYTIEFVIVRKDSTPLRFTEYDVLERAFANKEIHPADLKAAVVTGINALLDPIRTRFQTPEMLVRVCVHIVIDTVVCVCARVCVCVHASVSVGHTRALCMVTAL